VNPRLEKLYKYFFGGSEAERTFRRLPAMLLVLGLVAVVGVRHYTSPTTETLSVTPKDEQGVAHYWQVGTRVGLDGTLKVTERLSLSFPAKSHGLRRLVPKEYSSVDDKVRVLNYTNLKAINGHEGDEIEMLPTAEGELALQVGRKDRTIVGRHTYTLMYDVSGAITKNGNQERLTFFPIGTRSFAVPVFAMRIVLPFNVAPQSVATSLVLINVGEEDSEKVQQDLGPTDYILTTEDVTGPLPEDKFYPKALSVVLTRPLLPTQTLRLSLSWPAVGIAPTEKPEKSRRAASNKVPPPAAAPAPQR
jgi:hypothetical protein